MDSESRSSLKIPSKEGCPEVGVGLPFDLDERERAERQLINTSLLVGSLMFNLKCLLADNNNPESGSYQMCWSGILDETLTNLAVAENLITYSLENIRIQETCSQNSKP